MDTQFPPPERSHSIPAPGLERFPDAAGLEQLGVAFALLEAPDALRYVSSTALSVYGAPSSQLPQTSASLWTRLAEELGRCEPNLPEPATIRMLPLTEYCTASVRTQRVPSEPTWLLVVLHPVAQSVSQDGRLLRFGLTQREREVATLVADGRATKEIAARLGISFHTARHHTERVFHKLGVRARVEVARVVLLEQPQPRGERPQLSRGS